MTLAELHTVVLDTGRVLVTLAEMFEATSTVIQLEIKAPETVPHLARYFEAHPADAERTVLTSFQEEALRQARELMPGIQIGRASCRERVENEAVAIGLDKEVHAG